MRNGPPDCNIQQITLITGQAPCPSSTVITLEQPITRWRQFHFEPLTYSCYIMLRGHSWDTGLVSEPVMDGTWAMSCFSIHLPETMCLLGRPIESWIHATKKFNEFCRAFVLVWWCCLPIYHPFQKCESKKLPQGARAEQRCSAEYMADWPQMNPPKVSVHDIDQLMFHS